MSKSAKWIVIVIVVILIIWGINVSIQKDKTSQETIKIGVLTDLTGPVAAIGQIAADAVKFAVNEINQAGGVNGQKLEAIIEDYQYDSKKAVSAYYSLNARGVKFYLIDGSSGVGPTAPLIRNNKHLNIAGGAVLPSYSDGSPFTCRVSLTANHYGPKISEFILKMFPRARVAFLVSDNEYGRGVETKATEAIKKAGGEVVISEGYQQTDTDFRTQITKIKAKEDNIDALVIVNASKSIEAMLSQIRDFKFNKTIVADLWTITSNAALKNRSLAEGIYFVDYPYSAEPDEADSKTLVEFKKNFYNKYGIYPIPLAVNDYDAVKILALVLSKVKEQTPEAVSDYIINQMGEYEGAGGKLSFNSDCEVNRQAVIKILQNGVGKRVQ